MTDCYRILGVSRLASAMEIRAAFLAKMKTLHPDARRDQSPDGGVAGEISFAYSQLRDPGRRAEHDLLLYGGPTTLASPRRGAPKAAARVSLAKRRSSPVVQAHAHRRPRRSRRLQPLRTAAGVAACLVAGIGFAVAYHYVDPQGEAQARGAPAAEARGVQRAKVARRPVDPALATAAAQSFQTTLRRSGLAGAHDYARQCLLELLAHPTMSMLDYCVAFDDRAADWEGRERPAGDSGRRYFAETQRFGRYRSVVQGMQPGTVREAMRADVDFFAATGR